jgi:hypothetical protein
MTTATLNPLAELIAEQIHTRGFTYGDIARRGGIPKSTVHKLARTEHWTHSPRSTTLDRLAVGLELPPATVRRAASEAVGLTRHVDRDPELGVLIGSIEALNPDQLGAIRALLAEMTRQNNDGT